MRFEPTELTADEAALQAEVREFITRELPRGSFEPGLGMGAGADKAFTKKMAEAGYVGMALPKKYGGHDRKAVDRFIVVEELLRSGAPIGYHWVADRQTGSVINKFGTEDQRERFLPKICAGELAFSIGMSEPDSGSDLASVKTRAERAQDGWLVNGTKIWTSNAHLNDWFICLCRTSPMEDGNKHQGLSQLLIDLSSPGLEINTIPFLDGSEHFTEVVLTDVYVPDENVLGEVGMGWAQNTSEMAYERGGPDRWLSTFLMVEEFLRMYEGQDIDDRTAAMLGDVTARWFALHNLSFSVARMVDEAGAPSVEAALIKEMGTRFEQEVLAKVQDLLEQEPAPGSESQFERLLVAATLTGPSFTIRGGTIEILRSVASKGLSA